VTLQLDIEHSRPAETTRPSARRLSTQELEMVLLTCCLTLLALGMWGPTIAQPEHYHAFADRRSLLGIPNIMDVLSNMAFAGFGLVGAWRLWLLPRGVLSPAQRSLAGLFFFGLVATAACSGWYHLQPQDNGLAIDRYGMTLAFAGLLGLAGATQVSDRAGQCLALIVLVCGTWSIWSWSSTSNVLPWAVVQFGGIALMLGLACLPARADTLPVSWIAVILAYALAKVLELFDMPVYQLTGELVSGHTLKHLVASCAALPVLHATYRASRLLESPTPVAAVSAKR